METFFHYSGKKFRYDLNDGEEIIWMSERDGWNHLYMYDGASGEVKHQITKGDWPVREVSTSTRRAARSGSPPAAWTPTRIPTSSTTTASTSTARADAADRGGRRPPGELLRRHAVLRRSLLARRHAAGGRAAPRHRRVAGARDRARRYQPRWSPPGGRRPRCSYRRAATGSPTSGG